MRVDADQIVNMRFADVQEIVGRAVDAENDFANCAAALLVAERDARRNRRAFLAASVIAGVMAIAAIAGWIR